MAYARMNEDSDVYVIDTGDDIIQCTWCKLDGFSGGRLAMIEHLARHAGAGHKVPDYAVDRLRAEASGEIMTAEQEIALLKTGTHPGFQGPSAEQIRIELAPTPLLLFVRDRFDAIEALLRSFVTPRDADDFGTVARRIAEFDRQRLKVLAEIDVAKAGG